MQLSGDWMVEYIGRRRLLKCVLAQIVVSIAQNKFLKVHSSEGSHLSEDSYSLFNHVGMAVRSGIGVFHRRRRTCSADVMTVL